MEFLLQCGFLKIHIKYLFFNKHIENLIKSLKDYNLYINSILKKILLKL